MTTIAHLSKPVILVVEDDALLRMTTAEVLEGAGYGVVQAENADEALDVLKNTDQVDIVFTDIQMPGTMDGLELAQTVRDKWPPICLVVTSGRLVATKAQTSLKGNFLHKRYQVWELVSAMEECLCPN